MLNENEGSGKDQFLGDPDWLSEMQYNKSAICGLLEPVLSRALRFRRACTVRRLASATKRTIIKNKPSQMTRLPPACFVTFPRSAAGEKTVGVHE